jgi:uncharacterized membrane protein YeiH
MAVGGGVLRDIVAGEIPALVSPHTELYAVRALAGAAMVVLGRRLDYHEAAIAVGAAVFVFIFRVVALARGWHAPQAWHRSGR